MNTEHIDLLLRLVGLFGTLWAGLLLLRVSRRGPSSLNDVGLISAKDLRIASWARLCANGIAFVLGLLIVGGSAWSIRCLVVIADTGTTSVSPGSSANVNVETETFADESPHNTATQKGVGTTASSDAR